METLPSDLTLSILKHVPDLSTLYCLVEASPAASRVFELNAAQVIESAFASGHLHEFTCAIIRIVAYVRCGALLPGVSNMHDFDNFYRHETTELRYDPPLWTEPPLRLVSGVVPGSVLRGILASHYHNESLMVGCLVTYLARFRAIQPMHLVDQDFVWTSGYPPSPSTSPSSSRSASPRPEADPSSTANKYVGAWQLQPASQPFMRHDIGPPTWCEEQRVLRALWRVQLTNDLRVAETTDKLEDGWPLRLYMRGLTLTPWVSGSVDPIQRPDLEPQLWQQLINVEDELAATVVDYARNIAATTSDLRQHTERDWPIPIPTQKDLLEVECYTSAMALEFEDVKLEDDDIGHHNLWDMCSPLQHVPWEFFRRRGFAIWCEARMLGYGLLSATFCVPEGESRKGANYSFGSVLMAWKSVLTEEEFAEVARRNRLLEDEMLNR